MIIDKLIDIANERSNGRKIKDIRIGVGYTCVMLDDGSSGLAYTFINELGPCCGQLEEVGSMIGRDCNSVICWGKKDNILKSTIGVAAINAVIHSDIQEYETGNIINEVKNLNSYDTFGMVGYFRPIINVVKQTGAKTYVFERSGKYEGTTVPDWAIEMYLPQCDVVIITGTAIINKTIDHILEMCKNAREVYIVGPSTTMSYEAFEGYNVTKLAGSLVVEPKKALEVVSQGGGTMMLKDAIKNISVKVKGK
ncbi:MAG: DUF364 domain-containing protein [Thermoanaerobacteraceae bacterium]|nr:DUF364 domain-containing protein [Thermoanaerobacteraceae bacterium]